MRIIPRNNDALDFSGQHENVFVTSTFDTVEIKMFEQEILKNYIRLWRFFDRHPPYTFKLLFKLAKRNEQWRSLR